MIIKEALGFAGRISSDSPRLDLEVMLACVLGVNRTYLFTWPEKHLTPQQEQVFLTMLSRRIAGEPVAYITGAREFWSLSLHCDPSTLIPRPDTECLVEVALQHLSSHCENRVLDLGTGTGAIALAIASERPQSMVIAADVISAAVAVAQKNSQRLKLTNIQVLQSDWFESIEGKYDLIVSNPPYIDSEDVHLQQGDVRFEPKTALVSAANGFADILHIVASAKPFLKTGAWLMLEHGYQQAERVRQIFDECGYDEIFTANDLSGLERVSGGRWPGGVNE